MTKQERGVDGEDSGVGPVVDEVREIAVVGDAIVGALAVDTDSDSNSTEGNRSISFAAPVACRDHNDEAATFSSFSAPQDDGYPPSHSNLNGDDLLGPYDTRIFHLPVTAFFVHDVFLSKMEAFCAHIKPVLENCRDLPGCRDLSPFSEVKKPGFVNDNHYDENTILSGTSSTSFQSEEKSELEDQPQPQVEGGLSRKAMFCSTYNSFSDLEEALQAPCNIPFAQWVKEEKNITRNNGHVIFTMWHRVNELYNNKITDTTSEASTGPLSLEVPSFDDEDVFSRRKRGAFHVMRTHSVNDPFVHKTLALRVFCQLAEIACPSQGRNTDTSHIGNLKMDREEQKSVDCQEEQRKGQHKEEGDDNQGCVFYDILVSNDTLDRFHQVVEWTSWSSREAYEKCIAQPVTVQHRQILGLLCSASEETVWERNEELFISS